MEINRFKILFLLFYIRNIAFIPLHTLENYDRPSTSVYLLFSLYCRQRCIILISFLSDTSQKANSSERKILFIYFIFFPNWFFSSLTLYRICFEKMNKRFSYIDVIFFFRAKMWKIKICSYFYLTENASKIHSMNIGSVNFSKNNLKLLKFYLWSHKDNIC